MLMVLKDGEPISQGYSYVVRERPDAAPHGRCETVDLSTPTKFSTPTAGDVHGNAKNTTATKKNLTRNLNKKANSEFAKEVKDALASGRPPIIKLSEERTDLKARWHAAAKEVAYKLLDLRKESWKEYTMFEKSMIHKVLDEQYKFDPPIDPPQVDKYLSGHLRTSRAVWKAHWLKYGDASRHHNCPEAAWEKLIKWWPTEACQEVSAEMAHRRSKVQTSSRTGRKSLVETMDGEVSDIARLDFQLMANLCSKLAVMTIDLTDIQFNTGGEEGGRGRWR
jgi:hypothetical protein